MEKRKKEGRRKKRKRKEKGKERGGREEISVAIGGCGGAVGVLGKKNKLCIPRKPRNVYLQISHSCMSHTFSTGLLGLVSGDYHQKAETLERLGVVCSSPNHFMTDPHTTVSIRDDDSTLYLCST